jgi:hypothetical protein
VIITSTLVTLAKTKFFRSKVCHKMAEQAISQRNFDSAARSYKEALQVKF